MQISVVLTGFSVAIAQGRYFDRKRYSLIFQISVICFNILTRHATIDFRQIEVSMRVCFDYRGAGPATPEEGPLHDCTAMFSLTSYSSQMFSTFFVVMVTL